MTNLLRTVLLSSAAAASLAVPNLAAAQPTGDAAVDELVVTGSRIPRDTFSSPQPIQVISGQTIRDSGELSLGDVLHRLPAMAAATNAQNASLGSLFFAGQARVDLRGLGPARTLVLMDGRRHIYSDASSPAVDLNLIPSLMIDRIDVVAGGASAVYGSEAIAGVVNIIMRKSFEGFEGDVNVGISDEGDGEEFRIGALYGAKLADGRLNILVGGEVSRSEPILQRDRDWAYPGLRRNTSVNPQTVITASRSNQTPYGVFQLRPTIAVARDVRNPSQIVALSPACALATPAPSCQDESLIYQNVYNVLQNRVKRGAIRGYADYQLTDSIKAFAELSYARVEGYGVLSPAFSTSTGATPMPISIRGDNAFLNGPGATAAQLRAAWTGVGRTLTATESVFVGRFYDEFGGRNVDTERDTLRLVGGMEGAFEAAGRTVNWDWYAQYGELSGKTVTTGVPNVARLQQAVDAVLVNGQAVCRDVTARAQGCVPFDLVNGPSAEAVAWTNGTSYSDQTVKQTVVAANFNTSLFDLPAGPLGIAGGVEYRKEESSFVQDALSAAGALFQNAIGTRAGEYDVKEAYGEIRVPLLADLPMVESLSVEAAGRLADYSTIGHTEQYRLAAEWAPVRDVRFRASQGTAVRAPNIPELFAQQSTGFTVQALDPCDRAVFASASAAQRAARSVTCAAAIAGWNPATFNSNFGLGRNLRLLNGGNPDLGPETAHTYQVGVVIQPRMIPELKISFDFFKYRIAGGVTAIPVNVILQPLCYDSTVAYDANPFCALITRDPTGVASGGVAGGVSLVDLTQQNVAKVKVEGYDASVAYGFQTADLTGGADYGRFDLRLDVTRTYNFALQGLPIVGYSQLANTVNNGVPPEWKATGTINWTYDRLSVGWTTRFIGSMITTSAVLPSQFDPYFTGDHYEHDLQVKYRFNDQIAVRGGAINLTDETPPLTPETFSGTSTGASNYDNRGRFFYVGATFSY